MNALFGLALLAETRGACTGITLGPSLVST